MGFVDKLKGLFKAGSANAEVPKAEPAAAPAAPKAAPAAAPAAGFRNPGQRSVHP